MCTPTAGAGTAANNDTADTGSPTADAGARSATVVASTGSPGADAQSLPRVSRRRRNQGIGPQACRARVVMRRIWPGKYPTKDQVSDADLYARFAEEYAEVEGKADPPSKWGMPSRKVVLREAGRAD
jgi:hypothetical protein